MKTKLLAVLLAVAAVACTSYSTVCMKPVTVLNENGDSIATMYRYVDCDSVLQR